MTVPKTFELWVAASKQVSEELSSGSWLVLGLTVFHPNPLLTMLEQHTVHTGLHVSYAISIVVIDMPHIGGLVEDKLPIAFGRGRFARTDAWSRKNRRFAVTGMRRHQPRQSRSRQVVAKKSDRASWNNSMKHDDQWECKPSAE